MAFEKANFGRQNDNFYIISNLKDCALSDNNKSSKYFEKIQQIQKTFLWGKIKTKQNKKVKIKQNTLRNDYKDGGLKIVDTENKIVRLKCS